MRVQLRDILEIVTGFQVRSRKALLDEGEYQIIQMRNIDTVIGKFIENSEYHYVSSEGRPEKFLLHDGDVIIPSKGNHNVALLITQEANRFIASNQFYILRINKKRCLPEYLLWFLNNRDSQSFFDKRRCGTSTQILKKEVLANLEIILPSLEEQNKVVSVNNFIEQEIKLLDQLKDKKRHLAYCLSQEILNL